MAKKSKVAEAVAKSIEKKAKKKVVKKFTQQDAVDCETELRKYIKRSGGFRKGIDEAGRARANDMLKKLGRKGAECDNKLVQFKG